MNKLNVQSTPVVYYTCLDRFFEAFKYALVAGFAILVHYLMQVHLLKTAKDIESLEFKWRDLAITILTFAIYRAVFDKLMLLMFKMETLGMYDRLMMEDSAGNWVNIIGAGRFEK